MTKRDFYQWDYSLAATMTHNRTTTKNGCWVRRGHTRLDRYQHQYVNGRITDMHVIAAFLCLGLRLDNHGNRRGELMVCHHCDTPACFNPAHLFLGTSVANRRDCVSKGRDVHSVKTHCVNGHAFDDSNTQKYVAASGGIGRYCRACAREKQRRYRVEKGLPVRPERWKSGASAVSAAKSEGWV